MNPAIFNIRPALEEGARGFFSDQAIAAYTRQNAPQGFQNPRPRVEILCKVGSETGHRHIVAPGVYHTDTWTFDFAIRCVANPSSIEGENLELNQLVSTTRAFMQTFGQATWVDVVNFPNHLIVEPLKDTTTDDTLQSDDNDEFSILNYSGIVQIRTHAWS